MVCTCSSLELIQPLDLPIDLTDDLFLPVGWKHFVSEEQQFQEED